MGCVDYIIKPVNPFLVKARVKTHSNTQRNQVRQQQGHRSNAENHSGFMGASSPKILC